MDLGTTDNIWHHTSRLHAFSLCSWQSNLNLWRMFSTWILEIEQWSACIWYRFASWSLRSHSLLLQRNKHGRNRRLAGSNRVLVMDIQWHLSAKAKWLYSAVLLKMRRPEEFDAWMIATFLIQVNINIFYVQLSFRWIYDWFLVLCCSCCAAKWEWTVADISGSTPMPRAFHTAGVVSSNPRLLYIFAGESSQAASDLCVLNLESMKWSRPLFDGSFEHSLHGFVDSSIWSHLHLALLQCSSSVR